MKKKLTELQIKNLSHSGASNHIERHKDISNLYLDIKPSNTKSWLYRYNYKGKQKSLGLGGYPTVSLKQAREITLKYNYMRSQGLDPKEERLKKKNEKHKNFKIILEEWFAKKSKELSESTAKKSRPYIDNDILPYFANRNIDKIKLIDIVEFFQQFPNTPNKQRKLKVILSGVYKYAVAKGIIEHNLLLNDFSEILTKEKKTTFPFIDPIKNPKELAELLNDIDNYTGTIVTSKALKLAPYIAFRPSMITNLKWSNIDEENKLLIIEAENMKLKQEFRQPLSEQALYIIKDIQQYTGDKEYVFSNFLGKHIRADTLRAAMQRYLGYNGKGKLKFTSHGWRHVASTGLYSLQRQYKWQSEAIEMILDHRERNSVKAVYNKYDYLYERREILQVWANYLDNLKKTYK